MRLRSHYIVLALSIVVPAAVFGAIALHILQDTQHSSAIGRIEQSATLTARAIDADIYRAQSVLKVLGSSHALARGDLARFYEEAREASAAPGGWIILYDTNGQQLLNTRRAYGVDLPRRPDPDQVTAMLASGQGQVTGIKWGEVLKNHFVMVEQPIRTPTGQRYVIGQAFSPAFFAHSFAGRTLPPGWRVAILDRAGIIIARSENADKFVGLTVRPATLAAINKTRSGVFTHLSGDGNEVVDAFTRSERSGWSVIIGAPLAEIDAAVWRGVPVMSAGLVIALIAALALAMVAGRHLVRFVARASQAAALLGRGGEVNALARSGIHELESLNEAIREASKRLQAEMRSRSDAENERNALLVSEKTARARAEEQNAAKDEFLAMLGHELRNPLSAVASAVSILDNGRNIDDAMAQRARDVLRRQTDHLRKLVDDLLEVNRALMGKLELDKTPVNLAEVLQRCVDTLKASGRTAAFTVRLDTVPATVNADPTRLLQVIDNLLDNAIKYSPGGGEIVLSVRHVGDAAELSVRDSGLGIPADLLPHVFDIFVQGKQSLQRAHGGLGIGLSLVRRLVELHGGFVRIDSEGSGKGSTATVTLPRLAGHAAVAPDAPAAQSARLRRVLLVEDNADAREMMSMLLQLRSCEVVSAASGPEAIATALAVQPELAFIDIGLPDMDGYAVARALKADERTAGIELIALTGYGSEKDRTLALEAGFARHFTKPIRLEDLDLALS
ncbi:hybrid sensor histidine kinase/response regulator [Massilia pseudoviolaceinigra]|uniref:hybrid sensor histidine kinase/response regulator n=1 Tax=Massilia pseudoviolaceinigra TaxID=3057165 RepID=UPI002796492A|nr:ATP-binding protein [Massilia sp. CCM 9206]MDQ1921173.1 ATP-binding protein [Massilia sp. CCM 9206]